MDNVVNWGLVKSAWAPITVDANGNDVYGAPRMFRGLRIVSFTANGELVRVYADGTTVYVGKNNNGYSGSMEFTNPDEDFLQYALGEGIDSNNLQYEELEPTVNRFALLWEWEGDQRRARHCMYNVTASRPDISATTKGDGGTKTPQYMTLNLEAISRANDDVVKIRTRSDTDATIYANWFNTVPTINKTQQQVTVTVKSGSTNIENAMVAFSDGTIGYTGSDGTLTVLKSAGTYSMYIYADGYTAEIDSLTVASAAVTKAITLTAAA